jgi:hypothetical protein
LKEHTGAIDAGYLLHDNEISPHRVALGVVGPPGSLPRGQRRQLWPGSIFCLD